MNKTNVCPACNALKNGVKSRIAFTHTCELGNQNEIIWDDIKAVKDYLDNQQLALLDESGLPKIRKLGEAKTIGELKALLKDFDDNISFGFRNQPMQDLIEVAYDNQMFVVFQETESTIKEWQDECERLARIAEYWQKAYYDLNGTYQPNKIDNL